MNATTTDSRSASSDESSIAERRRDIVWRELEWCARLAVGGIFLWSATAHLANPYYFLSTVYQYELTSAAVGAIVASVIPFLELLLAACLLSGACPRATWLLSAVLLLCFVGVQSSALARDLRISCGCFGAEESQPINWKSISFTGVLAVLAIAATINAHTQPSPTLKSAG